MKFFNRFSLRIKILVVVNLIVLVLGTINFLLFQNFKGEYVQGKYDTIRANSETISFYIQDQFYERYGDVQAFALNETVRSFDKHKMSEVLDEYVALYGLYDVILVVDKNGKFVAANTKDVSGKPLKTEVLEKLNYSSTSWFKKAIKGEFTEDKSKNFAGTLVEEFQFDPIRKLAQGTDKIGVSFTAQIKDSKGEVIGVITNRSTTKWVEES